MTNKQRYLHRKTAGLCIRCGAGLTDDDSAECVECAAATEESSRRYRTSEHGRARKREHVAADRKRRRELGKCRVCSLPAVSGRTMCEAHAKQHSINVQASKDSAAASTCMECKDSGHAAP